MLEKMQIQSAQGTYFVHFFETLNETGGTLNDYRPTHFVIDRNVFNLHQPTLQSLIAGRPTYLIDATEDTKTLSGVSELSSWLQANGANRSSRLVGIGGGITQDLVTFTAHCYYRGIPWCFLPTTLLSMCDSSIGAKCGINLNEFKNQLGVFQSPSAVITCAEFLKTLPDFHIASGYGEILKLHLTANDWNLFDSAAEAMKTGLRNPSLSALIRKSLEVKKQVIEADEYEADYRRVLNYGHSFGHSLEAITNHEIPHGLAVAWGMDIINFIALKRNFLSETNFWRVHKVIQDRLPFQLKTPISAESLINGSRKDKKTDASGINLVFLKNEGNLEIKKVAFDDQLKNEIAEYLSQRNVYAGH